MEREWNEVKEGNMPHEKGMILTLADGTLTKLPEEELICILFECLITIKNKDESFEDKEVVQCYWSMRNGWLGNSFEELSLEDWNVTHWMPLPDPA